MKSRFLLPEQSSAWAVAHSCLTPGSYQAKLMLGYAHYFSRISQPDFSISSLDGVAALKCCFAELRVGGELIADRSGFAGECVGCSRRGGIFVDVGVDLEDEEASGFGDDEWAPVMAKSGLYTRSVWSAVG